ncbi:hypothetical protein [Actinoplanes sp. NPDC020271]|uniref:hypothetical protein n=1 Tax=Actinoplanes sp. NPDC020271 TaxID=3363896 RepID=UPI0037A38A69
MTAPELRRASACLVIDIVLTGNPPWTTGPYPGPSHGAAPAARLGYLESRVAEAVYGRDGAPVRWHREVSGELGGAELFAAEILRTPLSGPDAALAILHVRLPDPGVLGHLARHPAEAAPFLPDGATVSGGRALTLTHLTFTGPPVAPMPAEYGQWPVDRQWLWLAASSTPVTAFPPDVDDQDLFAGLLHLSADWRALVLRDGVAFVGLTADPGGERTFHAAAETYVHSIYLDALLLGRMQVHALRRLSNGLGELRVSTATTRDLHDQQSRLMELRRTLWSEHLTMHGHANDLLERYQAQYRLGRLREQVMADLADLAHLVDAQNSRTVNAGLGLLTVIGLPFGLTYAGGAVLADQSLTLFLSCTGVAILLVALLLFLFPPLRQMVDALGPRTRRRS